jgi:hypothetical protein
MDLAVVDLTVPPDITVDKPAAPTNLLGAYNVNKVDITWTDASSDEIGFREAWRRCAYLGALKRDR